MAKLDPRHAAWTVPLELEEAEARTGDEGADVSPTALARLLARHMRAVAPEAAEWNHHDEPGEELDLELEEPALRPDPAQDDGTPKGWPPI